MFTIVIHKCNLQECNFVFTLVNFMPLFLPMLISLCNVDLCDIIFSYESISTSIYYSKSAFYIYLSAHILYIISVTRVKWWGKYRNLRYNTQLLYVLLPNYHILTRVYLKYFIIYFYLLLPTLFTNLNAIFIWISQNYPLHL